MRAQNAALLMTKCDDTVNIEAFELSPRNESVITTLGRLQRTFPGPSLAMSLDNFSNPEFLDTTVDTLERMSHEEVAGTKIKVRKAGQDHDEDRDTTHPKVVTELFMAFLRPMCESCELSRICKNTREEVMYRNARFPWRRSSTWLMARVAMQLAMARESEKLGALKELYKSFMLFFMSYLLRFLSKRGIPSEYLHVMSSKISRRLLKLDLPHDASCLCFVRGVLESTTAIIGDRWRNIQVKNGYRCDLKLLRTLNFSADIHHNLTALDGFLSVLTKKATGTQSSETFILHSDLIESKPTELPDPLRFSSPRYRVYNLIALERWVAEHLGYWMDLHLDADGTCSKLAQLMKGYHTAAMDAYDRNPEALSVMLLTLLELWVACDKSAVHKHNLLRNYDPCIPTEIFQTLLLPLYSHEFRIRPNVLQRHGAHQSVLGRGTSSSDTRITQDPAARVCSEAESGFSFTG